jgi:hypothetical protein
MHYKPVMLDTFSSIATDFISKLLHKNPRKRLGGGKRGVENIKTHPFFSVSYFSISGIIQ